jgi:hypothetical protein
MKGYTRLKKKKKKRKKDGWTIDTRKGQSRQTGSCEIGYLKMNCFQCMQRHKRRLDEELAANEMGAVKAVWWGGL